MPIAYTRDDANERATIAIDGPFNRAELLTVLARHRAEGGWPYALFYDLRQMTGEPTREDLREFASLLTPVDGELPRGPVAVLATDPAVYAKACTYAAMMKSRVRIQVFRDRADAATWLSLQTRG